MILSDKPSLPALATAPLLRRARSAPESATDIVWSVALLCLIALPLPYLLRPDHGHYVTALLLALAVAACSFYSQRGAIVATLVFLAFLGDYRRYAGYFQGYATNDPLLLVAPAVALILIGQSLLRGRAAPASTLGRLVMGLMVLMFIEMFNPSQGDLTVGIAGALFYLAPMLWFWVGRSFASLDLARRVTWAVIAVGVAATVLGLYQAYMGLLPFEQLWVEQVRYESLRISDDVVRAIGFFSSSAEYQRYLIVVSAVVFALWVSRRSALILLLPVFLMTIFLSAARGPVLMVLLSIVVVWAVSARRASMWLPRLAVAGIAGAAALVTVLLVLQASPVGGRVSVLVDRQVGGLLDPGNEEKSTAAGHVQMIREGILTGITAPAGLGLGATTTAAQKYGSHNLSAEVDLANVMISMGILGGVLYLVIVVLVLGVAVQWWRRTRETYALVILGVLVGTLGGWLIGGEYSVAALLWFQIGLMDRLSRPARRLQQAGGAHAHSLGHT